MKVYTKFDTSDHVFLGFSTHNTQALWVRVQLTCLRWMTQTDWDPHSPEKHVADVHCHSAERKRGVTAPLVSSKASELLLQPVLFHTFTDAAEKEIRAVLQCERWLCRDLMRITKPWARLELQNRDKAFLHLPAKGQVGAYGQETTFSGFIGLWDWKKKEKNVYIISIFK